MSNKAIQAEELIVRTVNGDMGILAGHINCVAALIPHKLRTNNMRKEIKMVKDIYSNIAEPTNGDIYIGVVGPVRTGKST